MIRVFDESGKEVNPTYPKRARGLVKQGRARFEGDGVIVLTPENTRYPEEAYPSDIDIHTSEDTNMFEYNENEAVEAVEKVEATEEIEKIEPIEESGLPLNEELNRLYGILERIDGAMGELSYHSATSFLPDDSVLETMSNESIDSIASAAIAESSRLTSLAVQYCDIRGATVRLIEKVKDDAKPAPVPKFDE